MKVDWPEAEAALRATGRTVHIGVRRGWSSSIGDREVIEVGGVRARVARRLYGCTYADFPQGWLTMNTGDHIDPATAVNYGLTMDPTTLSSLGPDTLVKVLRANRTHYGVRYVLGRNDCPQPFNDGECSDGGLYACRLKHLFRWVSIYPDIDHVAVVEIPADAQRVEFATKVKASALVLTRFLPLVDAMEAAVQHSADKDYALRGASHKGHLPVVRLLVEQGADVHANNDEPLCGAAFNGHLPVVQFLVEHGADVHANDDHALLYAAENGHLPVVQFLVEHGADVHVKKDQALRWAAGEGYMPVVQFLVEHGADIHVYNDEPLRDAAENGHLHVVQFLVEQGANVHAHNDEALIYAADNGYLPVVQFLVEHGADIHAQDDKALSLASKYGHLHVVQFLQSLP